MVCERSRVMCDCNIADSTKLLTETHKLIASGILSQITIGKELARNIMWDSTFYGVWFWLSHCNLGTLGADFCNAFPVAKCDCDLSHRNPDLFGADFLKPWTLPSAIYDMRSQWRPVTWSSPIRWEFSHIIFFCHLSKSNMNFDLL